MRQGRLDAAIEEYASVVEAFPRDWNTANLLGDLYIRAGRTERAVTQYARIADLLAADGFLSKAAALYKKIVKISPDDENAMLRAADLAAKQGLLADARGMLQTLFQRRLRAGDRAGAVAIARRHGTLDESDVVGRLEAARMLAEVGDATGASENLRVAGDALAAQGRDADALRAWREAVRINPADRQSQERITSTLLRQGDLDAAQTSAQSAAERKAIANALLAAGRLESACSLFEVVLESDPADVETRLQLARVAISREQYRSAADWLRPALGAAEPRVELAMAECDLRSGNVADGATRLSALIARDVHAIDDVAALGVTLADTSVDAGFRAVGCALDVLATRREFERSLGVIEQFHTAAPGYVPAYERQAGVCRDGRYDDLLYDVEQRLADLYLADGRFEAALPIAERLAELRPDVERHRAQIAEALTGLGRRDPAATADAEPRRVSQEAFDLAEFAASLGLPAHLDADPPNSAGHADTLPPLEFAPAIDPASNGESDPEPAPESEPASVAVDGPIETGEGFTPAAPEPADSGVIEIELVGELNALAGPDPVDAVPAGQCEAGTAGADLDAVFLKMRDESGRALAEAEAMRAYDAAATHYNEGRTALAVECLRRAGRDSSLRFRACVMLARISLEQENAGEAIAWFERASEAPAPSAQAAHTLFYDLADTLERAGEPARAHAVFLELQSVDPGYRDVADRLARLRDGIGTGQTGGRSSKGPA